VEPSKSLFTPFSFSQEKKQPEGKSSFSFGAAPSTPTAVPEKSTPAVPAPFTFGSSSSSKPTPAAATPPIAFSFSGGGNAGTDVTTKPSFIFGVQSSSAAAHPERPVTPPKTHDQEVRMEESPIREMQINGKAIETPSVLNAQFSFGGTSNGVNGSTLFGDTSNVSTAASTTTPFTFGASSTTSNPFAAKKPQESKPFGGFGAH
jgi:nucleoporin NUP1